MRRSVVDQIGSTNRGLAIVAIFAAMTFLLVATSPEFARYAPLPVTTLFLRIFAIFAGIAAAILTARMQGAGRIMALALVAVGPLLAYGGLLILFWSALGTGLMDVIVVTAARRVLSVFITTGILGVFGVMLGLGLSAFLIRD